MIYKISGLLLLGGLAGCTMGPDYRKVEPVVPKHWQAGKVPEAGLEPVLSSAEGPASPESLKNWWKSFGDARLDHLDESGLGGKP